MAFRGVTQPAIDAGEFFRRRLIVASLKSSIKVDAGIDRTYVSRLERGLEIPSVAVLEKLSRALSSNIEEFFTAPRAERAQAARRFCVRGET